MVFNMLPLIVDLDGTLLFTDMLHESTLRVLRDHPLSLFYIPRWLSQGKAVLKKELSERACIDIAALPYNHKFIDWLLSEKENGRKIFLCTASDIKLAKAVADHLNIFDDVFATNGKINLAGQNKADFLEEKFGFQKFDYAGNSSDDLLVWEKAHTAIVVNAPQKLLEKAKQISTVERVFPTEKKSLKTWLRVFRLHQWLKNILLFTVCVAAHRMGSFSDLGTLIIAFFSFSLCASSVYITNDLFDLDSDRLHIRKKKRPFASGRISIETGILLTPILLIVGFFLAFLISPNFTLILLIYLLITSAYTVILKRIVLIDCIILSLLYTTRVIAGGIAIDHEISPWLLALSVFLFLSLAFIKRCTELKVQAIQGKEKAHGRGYHVKDKDLIQQLGVASGFAAVLVLALYMNGNSVKSLYKCEEVIWLNVPVLLFWISWMWLKVQRNEMSDDPVLFAIKDKTSLVTGATFILIFILGMI